MQKKILHFSLTLSLLPFLGSGCQKKISPQPDLIVHHAMVYTVDTVQPWAEAVAIRDGKIFMVGNNDEILATKSDRTELLDAHGAFLMPGFIEGHGHFPGLGASLINLNLLHTSSWKEIIDSVAVKVKSAKPGEWIIGRGWHQDKWTETPAHNVLGYPYHHALSEISPHNPVMLEHASGHGLIANQAAMQSAGVSPETANPSGGHIVRGDGKEPIGVFEENATLLIEDAYREYLTTRSQEEILAEWYRGIELAQNKCLQNGITSFQDAGSSMEEIQRLEQLALDGKLRVRLWTMLRHTSEFLHDKLDPFPKVGLGNHFFTCRALKVSIDGALGSYGAWLLDPYADNPGVIGQNTVTPEEVRALGKLCAEHSLQLCTHAIGDRANREVLNIYEEFVTAGVLPKDHRWRIEHAQHLDPADIPRFTELGVIASMQGIHCTSDAPFVEKRLGAERARTGAYAWRTLLDHNTMIGNGTDTPVEDLSPLASFHASVTRQRSSDGMQFYPEQRMTRAEAIFSYTMANAIAAFEEDIKGSLSPGKYADLVLLSNNLMTCPDAEILNAQILVTVVNGKIVHRDKSF